MEVKCRRAVQISKLLLRLGSSDWKEMLNKPTLGSISRASLLVVIELFYKAAVIVQNVLTAWR